MYRLIALSIFAASTSIGCQFTPTLEPQVPGEEADTKHAAIDSTPQDASLAGKALDDAVRFREDGQYEKALERHLWYHENALKHDPSHFGVRLSFALGYWAELGKVYPEAKAAMRKVRDEALQRYRRSPKDEIRFLELMSLDFELKDFQSAREHFYEGRRHGVESSGIIVRLDKIVETGDFKWAKDVVGDPAKRLRYYASMEQAVKAAGDMKDGAAERPSVFDGSVADLIRVVRQTHSLEEARALHEEALKLWPGSTAVKNALK